ncbi:MAG TPA: ABC transporter permease [Dehalococcoidia bacterium]
MDLIWDGLRQSFWLLVRGDARVYEIMLRSLLASGAATLLALLIGVPAGTFLALRRFPGRALVLSAVHSGMGLPPVVVGLVLSVLFWRTGPLGDLGLLYTVRAIVIAQTVIATPIVTGFTVAGIQALDPRLRLQILALGASRLQLLWLLLKEARLPLMAAVIAAFGAVISEVGAAIQVGSIIRGETELLTTATVLATQRGDFGLAFALSVILLALVFCVNAVFTLIQQRGPRP